jgi:hypothetical protein
VNGKLHTPAALSLPLALNQWIGDKAQNQSGGHGKVKLTSPVLLLKKIVFCDVMLYNIVLTNILQNLDR